MTGVKTPPVMITTKVGLALFLKMAVVNESLNLLVTFEELKQSLNGKSDGISQGIGCSDGLPTGGASISLSEEDLIANFFVG